MKNVVYLMDYIEKDNDRFIKHKSLYDRCFKYFVSVPEYTEIEPTEAELDALEAEFMAAYGNFER